MIQFADVPFLRGHESAARDQFDAMRSVRRFELAVLLLIQFDKLMTDRALSVPHFQPILDIRSGKVTGYEVLGRSNLFGLKTPRDMFLAASEFISKPNSAPCCVSPGLELCAAG